MTLKEPAIAKPNRLVSLDALRGFDMFWIAGGESLVAILDKQYNWAIMKTIHAELHHPAWNGFTFYDLIFPLFMFISGVSFTYTLHKRREQGVSNSTLYRQIFTRAALLVFFGCIYNGLLSLDFVNQRYPSVLGRIGLGYLGGALIAMHTSWRGRIIWSAGLLIGYWVMMTRIPVPGFGAGDLVRGHTWSGYIDQRLLPGRLYQKVQDPEGLFSTLPAIVNVLAGVMTGEWLKREDKSGFTKFVGMLTAGILIWGAGKLWNFDFPINKNLWTSSFVLVTVGWSLIFLSVFYLVIDVWKWRWGTLFFVVIGANPLFIYLAGGFIAFHDIAHFILGNSKEHMHPFVVDLSGHLFKWLVLYYMYRKNIFLRL